MSVQIEVKNEDLKVPLNPKVTESDSPPNFFEKLFFRFQKKETRLPPRILYINSKDEKEIAINNRQWFHGNSISTTKYKWWNFLFLNLFEQFYNRHANLYFLLIAIISLIPGVSSVGSFGTILTLSIVVIVQMFKDLIEDVIKFYVDTETNRRTVLVARESGWVRVMWKNIKTGDIVKVYNKDNFPADLLMIDSSDVTGGAFIETAMLDGETDLKYRKAPEATWKIWIDQEDSLKKKHQEFYAKLEYDQPNTELYKFSGNLMLKEGLENKIPISNENILLRV